MQVLKQHIESITSQFDSIKTEMKAPKINGAQRSNSPGEHFIPATLGVMKNTLIRNFMTKAENGTISIHQLTSFQMFTGATKGAHALTVFLQTNMSENYSVDLYNEDRSTYYDGNIGALQNLMSTFVKGKLEYNAVKADTNVTNALIPIAANKWDNVEHNKMVFATFEQIKTAIANDDEELAAKMWNGYANQVQQQVKDGLLINSLALIAKVNTIIPHKFPFINTPGQNPNWSGSELYGSEKHKRSYMPTLSTISGIAVKSSKDEVSSELLSTIKQNYLFGLRNSSNKFNKKSVPVSQTEGLDEVEFDPAADIIEEDNTNGLKVNASLDEKKEQVLTDLVLVSDINGRSTAIMLSVKDAKKDGKIIKRTGSYQAIQNGTLLSLVGCQVIPRSLNGKLSNGVIGYDKDGVLVGTLAVTFEIIKPVYKTMGTVGMGSGVAVVSDTVEFDELMDSFLVGDNDQVDVIVADSETSSVDASVSTPTSVGTSSSTVDNGESF